MEECIKSYPDIDQMLRSTAQKLWPKGKIFN